MSSDGFCFSFGTDDAPTAATPVAQTAASDSSAFIPIARLPLYTLTPSLLSEWAARYPQDPRDRMELLSSALPPLLYQRAPELCALTDGQRDIVPGRYYGGLKVWSCAADLVAYIFAHRDAEFAALSAADGSGVVPVVMEVGCGQGLPGIAALLAGARRVVFQDYNEEVLELCVRPNIAVNCLRHSPGVASGDSPAVVQLVAGDWSSLQWDEAGRGETSRCDVVFGSDVTFDEEACEKLADLLRRCLSQEGGVAYIASKQYYFGTNGGALEFVQHAQRKGLDVVEVWRIDETGGMQRLIMRVTHKCAKVPLVAVV